jgi:hypothetical protein
MSRLITASTLLLSLALTSAAASASAPAHEARPAELPILVDRAAVRAKLIEQRAANLARFRSYYAAKVYPSNVYTPGALNVWRDEAGHFCAAATIIRMSGEIALVDKVADDSNFIRLADVKQGPLMDWILTSGFTQEEIVMIQKPFRPVSFESSFADPPRVVDATLRDRETRRLFKVYRAVDAKLVKAQKASLERAVDRLMAHPTLALQLLAGA